MFNRKNMSIPVVCKLEKKMQQKNANITIGNWDVFTKRATFERLHVNTLMTTILTINHYNTMVKKKLYYD